MPATATLVTLTQAKAHLNITLPQGDPGDTEIQDLLDAAEDVIRNYLTDNPDRATWVDPETTPGPVVAAIKLMLGQLYIHRGDDDANGDAFWKRIDLILAQLHSPGGLMAIGDYKHVVTFQDPGAAMPDGAGGYTQTWADLSPGTWKVSVRAAAVSDLERVAAGTVVTQGSSIVTTHYHPGVSTKTRMLYNGKTYSITGARYLDTLPPSMELAVVEQVRP